MIEEFDEIDECEAFEDNDAIEEVMRLMRECVMYHDQVLIIVNQNLIQKNLQKIFGKIFVW